MKGRCQAHNKKAAWARITDRFNMFGTCRLFVALGSLLVFFILLPVSAEGDILHATLDYYDSTVDTLDKTTITRTSSRQILQNQTYTLNLDRSLYPLLRLNLGGVFRNDRNNVEQESIGRLRKQEFLGPRVGLVAGDRSLSFGFDYIGARRNQSLTTAPKTEDVRDQFSLFSNWQPNNKFEFNLRLSDERTYNDPKTIDRTDKTYALGAKFRKEPFSLDYNLNIIDSQNKLVDSETTLVGHGLRASYRRTYPDRNLDLTATYKGNMTSTDFSTARATELQLPVVTGLYSLDDSPENGELAENALLVDGNKLVSAAPNIGKSGNPTFFVNLGVDFGSDTSVSQLYIYVDRGDLPADVTDSYIWSVYTSNDNNPVTVWQQHAVVVPADFNSLQNRFEISFPAISARYIKVTVTPLSITVPGPYDDILITEVEPWVDITRDNTAFRTIFHNVSLSLNKRLSSQTLLSYEMGGSYNKSTLNGAEDTRLSNRVVLNHRFTPVYSGALRVGLTNSWKSVLANQLALEYGASGQADFLKTLSMNLGFSGLKTEYSDGRSGGRDSLMFRTRAEVYRGAELGFNTGYSLIEELDGRLSGNYLVGFTAHLAPHPKFDLKLSAQRVTTDELREGDSPGTGATSSYNVAMDAVFSPVTRLALVSHLTHRNADGNSSSLKSFSVNWSALSDGELKFFLTYYESYRTELNRIDKFLSPGMAWRISQYTSLQLRYNWTTSGSDLKEQDGETFNGTFKMVF